MILDEFSRRTLANMEVALERACERLPPQFNGHEERKKIAMRIIERAKSGESHLDGLTHAALTASATLDKVEPAQTE